MKLNNEKSKEMIISFAKNGNFRYTIPNIKIDGIDVEQVDHAKLLLLLLNACVRVADVMIFTFVSLMPVHNVCRICTIIKQ